MRTTEELLAMYKRVEQEAHNLRGRPAEYSVLTGLCPVNVIEMQAQRIQSLLIRIQELEK
jgi:hypothetical protein